MQNRWNFPFLAKRKLIQYFFPLKFDEGDFTCVANPISFGALFHNNAFCCKAANASPN